MKTIKNHRFLVPRKFKKFSLEIILSIVLFLVILAVVNAAEEGSPVLKVTLLNQEPSPARAGDTVELRLRVENVGGGTVENLELEVLQNYPFAVIDEQALQNLGTLYAYQTGKNYINIQYKLKIDKDAVKGQHELKIRYRYSGWDWVTSSFNIDVTSKEFAQIIYVDKAKIEPGKETEMKFTITNIGNAPLQDMVFSWSEADGVILPVFSDDTKYIKYLDVGDSIELKYIVMADVNAEPGLYQLDLNLKFESTNATSTTIKTKAGIFVGGETDFDVAFSESTQGQTSLSVANTGKNPALSVSVRIPEQNNFRVTGSNSAIIGNLDKGDYTLVSFQIVSSGAGNLTGVRQRQTTPQPTNLQNITRTFGGSNNLRVVIDYTDTTGERRSVEKNVPIQFRASSGDTTQTSSQFQKTTTSFWQSTTFYVIIAIILIAGFVVYRKKSLKEKIIGVFKKK